MHPASGGASSDSAGRLGVPLTTDMGNGSGSPPRGRPFLLPVDQTAPGSLDTGGLAARTGWLLATSRIYAPDESVHRRSDVIDLLQQLGIVCDAARVSRWETGNQLAPLPVVRAYEQVTGRPHGTLTGLAHALRPLSAAQSALPAPDLGEELDRHFQMDDEVRSGADELELAILLASCSALYLEPGTWERLATRLLFRLVRSLGSEFVTRYEALRVLLSLPSASRHVLRTIGRYATDPDAHGVIQPITLLTELSHPRAQHLVLRMLSGDGHQLSAGAAWAAAVKLERGHFDDQAHALIERVVSQSVDKGPVHHDVDLVDVAARLPQPSVQRILARAAGTQFGRRLHHVVTHGEVAPRERAADISSEIAIATQEETPARRPVQRDQMLHRLIREALFHGHQARRHQAALLLAASPYAAALARQLAVRLTASSPTVSFYLAGLLRYVAVAEIERPLVDLAVGHGAAAVRERLLVAIGRLDGFPSPATESTLAKLATTDPDPAVRRSAVYALGMHASPELDRLASAPKPIEGALWWQRLGPGLHPTR